NDWDYVKISQVLATLLDGEIAVGCWVKLKDVQKGDESWKALHVYFTFKTLDGKETKEDVFKLDGTAGWKWLVKRKIAVPKNLKETRLTIGYDGVSGEAWFDRLTIVRGTDLPPETISASDEVTAQTDVVRNRIGKARTAIR